MKYGSAVCWAAFRGTTCCWSPACGFPVIFLIRAVAGYGNSYLINYTGLRVLEGIRTELFVKLQTPAALVLQEKPFRRPDGALDE